ncbi:UDP-N-acetylenolpyruvoylglucosamine reductase [Acetobacter orientalis]|uniref:UDP-N-acetylenolpyruvoylglucosamine reductase n=1 Tax=Acetobacter orientalis TaxID=146474 RepID=A0A2Z5ZLK8_9PROT|nr:UDP-N-acetylenolpyruvoylglucosamine reductase [Acetobacter orientalis]
MSAGWKSHSASPQPETTCGGQAGLAVLRGPVRLQTPVLPKLPCLGLSCCVPAFALGL